ncbi:hypothetical protein BaRGS_00019195 [Batillaria attramentaria]|uniref:Uncharacterized protein n=1 Tax=Batillaria attramentaria TaxID=370345 RepID=A0ABD0KRH4_9CAEN
MPGPCCLSLGLYHQPNLIRLLPESVSGQGERVHPWRNSELLQKLLHFPDSSGHVVPQDLPRETWDILSPTAFGSTSESRRHRVRGVMAGELGCYCGTRVVAGEKVSSVKRRRPLAAGFLVMRSPYKKTTAPAVKVQFHLALYPFEREPAKR